MTGLGRPFDFLLGLIALAIGLPLFAGVIAHFALVDVLGWDPAVFKGPSIWFNEYSIDSTTWWGKAVFFVVSVDALYFGCRRFRSCFGNDK